MSRIVTAYLAIDGVEGVVTGFKKAGDAAERYGKVAMSGGKSAMAWVGKHESELNSLAGGLAKAGALGAVALGGLVKSAIDWETAWAGVTKTVDGTPEQLEAISQGLRDMAKVLPTSHEELAAVAEAAGQLGVKTEDVLTFTRTMVDLGETTNLTSEEAATSLQQMMNVMGTAGKNVDRLGSTIVALGNNGASTEADIVRMGQRIAAAGGQIGMTETDVLGFAGALSSVGIEAEAGGSAISMTFKQIDADVRESGDQLELIAEVAGMSAADFAAAWRDDPAVAMADFVEGMGRMQASGEDVNGMLAELDIKGIRQTDSLLRLASATEAAGSEQNLLREQLLLAAEAWDENTALADEAAQRYETRAAQAQMAINSLKDAAITLGETMLPVFDAVVSGIAGIGDAIGGLPEPAQAIGVGILAVGTFAALAVSGVIKLATGLHGARVAMQAFGISIRTATLSMGVVGIALAAAGVALAAWSGRQADAKAKADAYTDAIKMQGEVIGESTRKLAGGALQEAGVLDLAEKFGANLADVTDAALGSAEAMDRVTASVLGSRDAMEEQIATNQREIDALQQKYDLSGAENDRLNELIMANGNLNTEMMERNSNAHRLQAAIEAEAEAVQVATDRAVQLEKATSDGSESAEEAAAAAQAHAEAEARRAVDVEAATKALEEALTMAQAYGSALLRLSGSEMGVEDSIASLTERLEELNKGGEGNKRTLDLQTESGRANRRALDDLASSSMSYIATLHEQGASAGEIEEATARARDEWMKGADAMGMSADEAEHLAEAYFAVPSTVQTWLVTQGLDSAMSARDEWDDALRSLSEEESTEFLASLNQASADEVQQAFDRLTRAREMNIAVRYVTTNLPPAAADRINARLNSAHGNVIDYFGHGGIHADRANRHIAQIAPAGSLRVWAEPETQGEAYIPFRRDARPRAVQIWRETGRRLGVQGYAFGGISGAGSSTTTYGPQSNTYNLSFPGVRTAVEMERAIMTLPQRLQQRGVRRG